ncbi:MAG: class I SAM-dependent methyltransferase [Desulfobacteraceae bacterium]|nr:class I SAM-dependent methyltransferase [Desulfobacteraceae bacterium]
MKENNHDIKLNIGCGGRPLAGYINIDSDDLETLKLRYPQRQFPDNIKIYDYDIFNLPFPDGSVAEVRADSLLEHLSFTEEPRFFYEVKRVLRPGGIFQFSTTDFEEIVKSWLAAEDDWKDFFRDDPEAIAQKHWFGQYSYSTKSRWGYLTASIFGSQNSEGQFHKNCYTAPKIRAILNRLEFQEVEISLFRWKGGRDPMIHVQAMKPNK